MNRRVYTYMPNEAFDFGLGGELYVTFIAWIDVDDSVTIWRAFATAPDGAEWNFTAEVMKYPERRRRYEEEIRADYLRKQEKDWEGEAV